MSDTITASDTRLILDAIQAFDKKLDIHIARTEEQFKTLRAEVKAEINELRAEVKAEINELRAEVKAEINQLRAEVKAEINELRTEVKAEINELRIELKGEIKALNDKVDDLRERQRNTDNRLWSFIVALILLLTGGLVKLTLFDKP